MGTRLLFIDVRNAFGLLVKQFRGYKITSRERGKIKRTLNDIATLIPITILMLIPVSIQVQIIDSLSKLRTVSHLVTLWIPCIILNLCKCSDEQVSAVGHAAMLAAIKKYIPSMVHLMKILFLSCSIVI